MVIWLVIWNMNSIFPYIGNKSWHLTFIYFRGVETTSQKRSCFMFAKLLKNKIWNFEKRQVNCSMMLIWGSDLRMFFLVSQVNSHICCISTNMWSVRDKNWHLQQTSFCLSDVTWKCLERSIKSMSDVAAHRTCLMTSPASRCKHERCQEKRQKR